MLNGSPIIERKGGKKKEGLILFQGRGRKKSYRGWERNVYALLAVLELRDKRKKDDLTLSLSAISGGEGKGKREKV